MAGVMKANWLLFTTADAALLRVGDLVGDLLDDDDKDSVGRKTRLGDMSTNGSPSPEMISSSGNSFGLSVA
jgi:hypothetical protein